MLWKIKDRIEPNREIQKLWVWGSVIEGLCFPTGWLEMGCFSLQWATETELVLKHHCLYTAESYCGRSDWYEGPTSSTFYQRRNLRHYKSSAQSTTTHMDQQFTSYAYIVNCIAGTCMQVARRQCVDTAENQCEQKWSKNTRGWACLYHGSWWIFY